MTDQTQTAVAAEAITNAPIDEVDPVAKVEAAADVFNEAWTAALKHPTLEGFGRADLAYAAEQQAKDEAEQAEKIAKCRAESRRECLRFAAGLVGKLIAENVIDAVPDSDSEPARADMDVLSYAITLVADQLVAAFDAHKFYAFESMADLRHVTR